MPNDGVGRVAPHGNQRQTCQSLLAACQTCHRQSSPESQTCPLPKLIGLKELEEPRHDVPLVSCFLLSSFYLILLIFDFKNFLVNSALPQLSTHRLQYQLHMERLGRQVQHLHAREAQLMFL